MPLPTPGDEKKKDTPPAQQETGSEQAFSLDAILNAGGNEKKEPVAPQNVKPAETVEAPPPVDMNQFLNSGASQEPPQPETTVPFDLPKGENPFEVGKTEAQQPPATQQPPQQVFPQQTTAQPPALQQNAQSNVVQPPATQPPTGVPAVVPPDQGIAEVDFGATVPRFPINRYKANTGIVDRIAIISKKMMVARYHYEDDIGYFYCYGGKCCERCGMPSVRYVLPVIKYDTNKQGVPVSLEFDIQFLQLGDEQYESLKVLGMNVPIDTVDLAVTCSDEKYQKNHYNNVGQALWRQPESPILQAVMQKYESVKKYIPLVIARVIDDNYLLNRQGGGSGGPGADETVAAPVTNLNQFLK